MPSGYLPALVPALAALAALGARMRFREDNPLRAELAAEGLAGYIRRVVDSGPPLTGAQRSRLALLLRPGEPASTETMHEKHGRGPDMGWVPGRRDAAGIQPELDAIGKDFPGWQPWRSSAGRCWAVRLSGARPADGVPAEWARTVDADTPEELRAVLGRQEGLAGHAR
jgi:hypothetical protein